MKSTRTSNPVAPATKPKHGIFRHTWLWRILGSSGVLILAVLLAFNLSPRPGSMLIKYVFESGADDVAQALEAHAPGGVTSITDQQYRPGDDDAYLDVYFPEAQTQAGEQLPTLIWTHGGAWISGHKDDAVPYLQWIAIEGYTIISLDYSLGPDHTYPTPIHQVNDALGYVLQNAAQFHIDPNRIMLAGDSAGAQITSQVATIITNPAYAAEMGITPSLQPVQLRAVILYCGIYDMSSFIEDADLDPGILGWGTRTIVWAYTGSRDKESVTLDQMSTLDHVSGDFPATFISGGNDDPLTDHQSVPLASKLESLGVSVESLFYPADHAPGLAHEYQFTLDNTDGQQALQQMLAFMKQHSAP